MNFNYISAPAGCGKTQFLIKKSLKLCLENKVIFCLPSIKLCDEIYRRFGCNSFIYNIHSNNSSKSVQERINVALDSSKVQIIIITQTAFLQFSWKDNKNKIVIWDESCDVTAHEELNIPEHKNYITNVLRIYNKQNDFCRCFVKEDYELFNPILENKNNDQFWKQLQPLYQHLKNSEDQLCDVWVHNKFYRKFLENNKKVVFTIVYNPSKFAGFKSVIFCGAFFEKSLMFNLWENLYRVNWKKIDIKFGSFFHQVPIHFKYFSDDFNWSKNSSLKKIKGKKFIDIFNDYVNSIKDKRILDMKNTFSDPLKIESVSCPFNNEGLNCFDKFETLVYRGSFNKPPAFYSFMKYLNLSEEAKWETETSKFYQTIMRTCIRKGFPVEIIVPTKSLIIPLLDVFENCSIEKIRDCAL